MGKISKLISAALVACIALTACGAKTDSKETAGKNADTTKDVSLQYIKDKGELVLGLDASFPPMGFKDDSDNIVGFDIDLAKEVTSRMGIKLKLQPINWDTKEMELQAKNIDCIWNGLSYSKDREEKMTLSKSYMTNRQVIVVPADSSIKGVADLKDKVVVVQSGSTASEAMDAKPEVKDSLKELVKVEDNVKAMLDLQAKGSDAVVMDEVVAKYYSEKNAGKFNVLSESMADEKYVIGFRKGDQALADEIVKTLEEMKKDGKLAQISKQWFGSDITTLD